MAIQLQTTEYCKSEQYFVPLANKTRVAFRKLGLFHIYRREGKLYTFDVPFNFQVSKRGELALIVVCKASLPRAFPSENFSKFKSFFRDSIGVPVEVYETSGLVAIGCKVSDLLPFGSL